MRVGLYRRVTLRNFAAAEFKPRRFSGESATCATTTPQANTPFALEEFAQTVRRNQECATPLS